MPPCSGCPATSFGEVVPSIFPDTHRPLPRSHKRALLEARRHRATGASLLADPKRAPAWRPGSGGCFLFRSRRLSGTPSYTPTIWQSCAELRLNRATSARSIPWLRYATRQSQVHRLRRSERSASQMPEALLSSPANAALIQSVCNHRARTLTAAMEPAPPIVSHSWLTRFLPNLTLISPALTLWYVFSLPLAGIDETLRYNTQALLVVKLEISRGASSIDTVLSRPANSRPAKRISV